MKQACLQGFCSVSCTFDSNIIFIVIIIINIIFIHPLYGLLAQRNMMMMMIPMMMMMIDPRKTQFSCSSNGLFGHCTNGPSSHLSYKPKKNFQKGGQANRHIFYTVTDQFIHQRSCTAVSIIGVQEVSDLAMGVSFSFRFKNLKEKLAYVESWFKMHTDFKAKFL